MTSIRSLDLPNELLLQIAQYLGPNDLNSLLRTNRFLSNLLTPLLHALAMQAKDRSGLPALCWAARKGHVSLAKLLLDKGVKVDSAFPSEIVTDSNGEKSLAFWSALMFAAQRGHKDIVSLLLERGADIEYTTEEGNTALNEAIWNDHMAVCRLLLHKGAKIEPTETSNGSLQPPLHTAVALNPTNEAMIELFLQRGADVNVRDHKGNTALHIAAERDCDNAIVAEILLKAGVDINAQRDLEHNLDTAMHTAIWRIDHPCMEGKNVRVLVEMVKTLIRYYPNINTKDGQGETVWDLARGLTSVHKRELLTILEGYQEPFECCGSL